MRYAEKIQTGLAESQTGLYSNTERERARKLEIVFQIKNSRIKS